MMASLRHPGTLTSLSDVVKREGELYGTVCVESGELCAGFYFPCDPVN
jgi:hypothetical protein